MTNQSNPSLLKKESKKAKGISLFSATALGIGGMMGAGLFSLLGTASAHAGSHIPLAFLLGAIAASFSVYSYAKLGATFPSSGGAATFTVMSFGPGVISGGLNIFQYIGYLIAAALYAAGFSEYANTLLGGNLSPLEIKLVGAGIVIFCAGINLLGTDIVGTAETLAIGFVTLALLLFSAGGIHVADVGAFQMSSWSINGIAIATGILYINYQGFGVVTNSSDAMHAPHKELPIAMFSALILVTIAYVLVSSAVILLFTPAQMAVYNGHVLADAAQIVAGKTGFIVIGASALLACAAALNATIFAASNIAADMTRKSSVSQALGDEVLNTEFRALTISAILVIALVLAFPLDVVGKMASLAFLLVYAAITWGHIRVRNQTGAKLWPLWAAIIINLGLFATLFLNVVETAPNSAIALAIALVGSFAIEATSRKFLRKKLKPH
ncbi:APC family permease [Polynucleobacter sp. JS-Polo-80-F4]|uniref:APC family permease n=1 Tax=Polynucleobacter sp. JS-Polo-80-F4 TaxID=2576918 RepID=UPI001C0B5488|nr:APC family permease [Polynucleobacter sp. JS-Polo-80-F4]MBU3617138.1 amino acid permease [Polynucleobacter sp. JS-Polo-80-F4]